MGKNHGSWKIPGCVILAVGQPLLLGLITLFETVQDFDYPLYHLKTFLLILSK